MSDGQRTAIVTGAAGGIGRALVGGLLDAGIRVTATDRTADGLVQQMAAAVRNGSDFREIDTTSCLSSSSTDNDFNWLVLRTATCWPERLCRKPPNANAIGNEKNGRHEYRPSKVVERFSCMVGSRVRADWNMDSRTAPHICRSRCARKLHSGG